MFCPKCGEEIKDGSKFCKHCGSEIKKNKIGLEEYYIELMSDKEGIK